MVIEEGQIKEQGSHHELMAARGHYFELYRQQSLQESSRTLVEPAGNAGAAQKDKRMRQDPRPAN